MVVQYFEDRFLCVLSNRTKHYIMTLIITLMNTSIVLSSQ